MAEELTLEERRRLMEDVLATAAYPERHLSGRGIVLCGGGEYFACVWVCVTMLRSLGCALPIELWYRGPREMTGEMIALMHQMNVVCVDAYAVAQQFPVRRLDGWELKAYAIAQSSFEEVLYLDSDNVPLRDPEFLFETNLYREHGALFWPDRYSGPGTGQEWLKREAWELCGVPYRLEAEIEAGQLLINKRPCWRALSLALHLNEYSDFYYAYFYGDKDTFRLAWHRASCIYGLVPWAPVTLGNSEAIVQFDLEGKPLFQHRNGAKWSLARPNPQVRGFEHETKCLQMLEILRTTWLDGTRKYPSDFSISEKKWYTELCEVGFFTYLLEGHAMRVLQLLPDLSIGQGAAEMEVGWMIEADKDGLPLLSLRNANAPTCFLRPAADGTWRGRWLVYDRGAVELRPMEKDGRIARS
jgi:hypothetical protein